MKFFIFLLILPAFLLSQDKDLDTKIKNYILENPKVIIESLNNYQAQIEKEEKNTQQILLKKNRQEISRSIQYFGNPNAKYIITEFFDYRCGYCVKAHGELKKLTQTNKNLKIVLKNLPILTQESYKLAKISLSVAIEDISKFDQFHTYVFNNAKSLNNEKIKKYLSRLGLDADKIFKLSQGKEVESLLDKDFVLAETLRIGGTPAFVINEEIYTGWVGSDTLKAALKD